MQTREQLGRSMLAVALGGSIAATLDITYAFTVYGVRGVSPLVILQAIASGILGSEAYTGGGLAAAAGLALHLAMMLLMAGGFVVLSHRLPILLRRPVLCGSIYGLGLFVLMNYVVVPLSAAVPGTPPRGWLLAGAVFAHIALVGIPIALAAARCLREGQWQR